MNNRQRLKPSGRNRLCVLRACGANEVYIWDITYLPSQIGGKFFYLYMVVDIYSANV